MPTPPSPPTPNTGPDPRSFVGIFARGRNDYNGSFSPPGAGRPRKPNIQFQDAIDRLLPQGSPKGNPVGTPLTAAIGRRLADGSGPYQL